MKRLYKNLKQPKTWDIFKYNPIKDKYFAEKEYQRLLTQYDAMEIFFIHLQTELRFRVNYLRFYGELSGVAIVCAIFSIFESAPLYATCIFIALFILFTILTRIHYQKHILIDRILFVWMLKNSNYNTILYKKGEKDGH